MTGSLDGSLKDKTVLVVGLGSGLARTIALAVGNAGACVVAAGLESRSRCRKAAAHAEIVSLLADMVHDPLLTGGDACVGDVMPAVGCAADGGIVGCRRRLLAHLRAGNGEGAALEMERHLRACSTCGASRYPAARRSQARWWHDRDDQ